MASPPTVHDLRQRIDEMQPLRLDDRALPTDPTLAGLLPERALRRGAAYSIQGSDSLALALLAAASTNGLWCAVIGCPAFGAEAAAGIGVALDRCALIPRPGDQGIVLAGLLSEAFDVVALRPPGRVGAGDAGRVAARLREHGSALVVLGDWPRTESTLTVTGSRWHGLGRGYGMLDAREIAVQSRDRRGVRQHFVRFTRDGIVCGTLPASNVRSVRA